MSREKQAFFARFLPYTLSLITTPTIQAVVLSILISPQVTHYVIDGVIWKNNEKTIDELVNDHINKTNRFNAQERKKRKFIRFVIWIEEVAIANAETFSRIIQTMEGSLEVIGLGAVCVREDFRGNNFGKDLVIKSFNRIVRGRV